METAISLFDETWCQTLRDLSCRPHYLTVEFVSQQDILVVSTGFTSRASLHGPLLILPAHVKLAVTPSYFPLQCVFSVRFGNVAIHIEVPGDFGQG